MPVSEYDHLPFDHIWGRLTSTQCLDCLENEGHIGAGQAAILDGSVESTLRGDGVLHVLHSDCLDDTFNGTMSTSGVYRKYQGSIFSQSAWLVRAAMETSFEADRDAFLDGFLTQEEKLDVTKVHPATKATGTLAITMNTWFHLQFISGENSYSGDGRGWIDHARAVSSGRFYSAFFPARGDSVGQGGLNDDAEGQWVYDWIHGVTSAHNHWTLNPDGSSVGRKCFIIPGSASSIALPRNTITVRFVSR